MATACVMDRDGARQGAALDRTERESPPKPRVPGQLCRCALQLLCCVLVSQANRVAVDGGNKKESSIDDPRQRAVTAYQLCTHKSFKLDLAVDGDLCSAVLPCGVCLHPLIDLPSPEVGHDEVPGASML